MQSEFSQIFNFAILLYSKNSRKFHVHEYIRFDFSTLCALQIDFIVLFTVFGFYD